MTNLPEPDIDTIRGVQKCFLETYQTTRDRDAALKAANIDESVMLGWTGSDAMFLGALAYVAKFPKATLEGTGYEKYNSKPADGPIPVRKLTGKEVERFFDEITPAPPDPHPSVFDNPKRLYHMIKGTTDADRRRRQAVFLHVLENESNGTVRGACRVLGINHGMIHQWATEGYPAYTPEMAEALTLFKTPEDKDKWREIPAYRQAINELMLEYGQQMALQARRDTEGRSHVEMLQDTYADHDIDTTTRQVLFLLALEKTQGNLDAATKVLGHSRTTQKRWRRKDEHFRAAVQEIVDSKGASAQWKTHDPYAEALRQIESSPLNRSKAESWADAAGQEDSRPGKRSV